MLPALVLLSSAGYRSTASRTQSLLEVGDCRSRETCGLVGLAGSLAIATLPAVALLVVVHGAVLAALFATGRLVRRERYRAHCRDQDRKHASYVSLHGL